MSWEGGKPLPVYLANPTLTSTYHSVVLNVKSPSYNLLHNKLRTSYEDLIFPLDAEVLLQNCLDFRARVQQANSNALAVANFLQTHETISCVNYPTMVATSALYERYRRANGGYGSLISMVFRNPESAVIFYDRIELFKGPSFGANFSLVLPYSQLAHAFELDWAESHGVAKHIIRISVGLEDEDVLIQRFEQALQEVKAFENEMSACDLSSSDRVSRPAVDSS